MLVNRYIFFLLLSSIAVHARAQDYYNVLRYGAKNDSSRLATKAIAAAISAASRKIPDWSHTPEEQYHHPD
jgi:hypothetical protein